MDLQIVLNILTLIVFGVIFVLRLEGKISVLQNELKFLDTKIMNKINTSFVPFTERIIHIEDELKLIKKRIRLIEERMKWQEK